MRGPDSILESFQLNPIDEYLDPVDLLLEGVNELDELYKEASENMTRRNVLQKIWGFIKKVFRLMGKAVERIIRFLQSLFKKKTKTANQIIHEMGIRPGKPLNISKNVNSKKVPIRSNPKSEMKMPEFIDLVLDDIIMKINKDNSITISYIDVIATQEAKIRGYGKIPGQEQVRGQYTENVLILIKNSQLMEELVEITKTFTSVIKNKNELEFINRYDKWDRELGKEFVEDDQTVTLEQIRSFQIKLNEMAKIVELFDLPNNSIMVMNPTLLKKLNEFANIASDLQMGMNSISGCLQHVYEINARYLNSIHNIEDLSLFVGKCIQSGIPPKYISYNAYLISDSSIKGDGIKGDKDNPKWGQSRVVFFPLDNKNIVYKIALSGFGIRANKSEYDISEVFEKNGGSHLIAKVIKNISNFYIISMELVEDRKIDELHPDIDDLKRKLYNFTKDHNIPLDIRDDIRHKNVGYKNGKCVALDYGMSQRMIS